MTMGISQKFSLKGIDSAIRSLFFFIVFYLYLWLIIEPHLIYHGAGKIRYFPVFYKDYLFFKEFLLYPGGLVEYLSTFLSQLFYFSWAGAIVITVQAWLIFVFCASYIHGLNAPHLKWLRFVPPILLIVLYSKYTFYFITTMSLTVALGFVWLYLKISLSKKSLNLIIFLILSVISSALEE